MLATRTPRSRAKPTKLTEDTCGDSQGQKTTLRRTSTVPEEGKPPPMRSRSNDLPDADGSTATTNTTTTTATNIATEMHAEQSNGSPDSILSGPLEEGGNSAPDSADSVAPTVPFPPISRSSSSFATSEPEPRDRKSRASGKDRRNTGGRSKDEQRAFGSPVSVDDDDAQFWDSASLRRRGE